MKATIWHNPACSKSREALQMLHDTPEVEVTAVEYLKHPPSAEKLAQLYRDAGMAARDGLRVTGTDAAERGLTEAGDAVVIAAMVTEPKLIERPLVETEKGVRLGRPVERIKEIL